MTQVVKPAHNLANMDATMSAAAPSLAPNSNNNGYRKYIIGGGDKKNPVPKDDTGTSFFSEW